MRLLKVSLLLVLLGISACKQHDSQVVYLANEGVAVFHDDTTLLFDPLFRTDFGRYKLVPDETREAIFSGAAPFERIAAVFVSHYHDDHFDPSDMLKLLRKHTATRLYAPQQAIDAMRAAAGTTDESIFARVTALRLDYESAPQSFQTENISVDAFFVPHAGWPVRLTDVQNIAFRVTVDGETSVVHLGDADPNLVHFEQHREEWHRQLTDTALPPYWFFNSSMGNQILKDYVRARRAVGIHVPSSYANPKKIPADLVDYDLFIRPGESRQLEVSVE